MTANRLPKIPLPGYLSLISHEIRNPLAVIQSCADLLIHYRARLTEEEQTDRLRKISGEVERIKGVLEDATFLEKIELGAFQEPERFHLQQVCEESIRHTQLVKSHDADIPVVYDLEGEGLVEFPKTLLEQILKNLAENAIKYTAPGKQIKSSISLKNGSIRIQFCNEATFPPRVRENLFKPFVRGSQELPGSGLGLTIIKRCADAVGGTVILDDSSSQEVQFLVELPTGPGSTPQ